MPIEITRNLKDINAELKTTDSLMKGSAKSASSLQKALKLDPTNTTLQAAATEALKNEIDAAQKKVVLLKEKQDAMVKANGPSVTLTPQYKELSNQIAITESKAKSLNTEVTNTSKLDLSYLAKGFKSVATTAAALLTILISIETTFANDADSIDTMIKKFGGTAEEWQYQSNAWDQLTNDANAYQSVLESVISVQANVQKESSKTGTILAQLGLTFDDLKGKSSTEALQIYMEALSKIGDESTRQSIAVALFGETVGTYVAKMCETSSSQIQEWNNQLTEAGVLTNEEVESGAELKDTFDYLKKSVSAVIASFGDSLKPVMESLVGLFKSLLTLLLNVSTAFSALGPSGVIALGIFASMLAALPSLILMLNALNVSTGNIALAALGYAALAAATGIAVGVLASTGTATSTNSTYQSDQVSSNGLEDESSNLEDKTSGGGSSSLTNNYATTSTKNVVDNSINNYYISKDVDADEVIEKISDRRRELIGG